MYDVKSDIKSIKGIGEKKSEKLNRIGISTVEDLLHYFPRTYEDRSSTMLIRDAKEDENVNTVVEVLEPPRINRFSRHKAVAKVLVSDGSEKAYLSWFNQSYVVNDIKKGDKLKVMGKLKKWGAVKEIQSPIYTKDLESKDKIGSIVPIYGLTKGLKNDEIIKYMKSAFSNIEKIEEKNPDYIREKYSLLSYEAALNAVHFPKNREEFKKARATLSFTELLSIQLGLLMLKKRRDSEQGRISFKKKGLAERFVENLPFELTDAQKKVVSEIEKDMESEKQMNRLVQGDVGSGKTVVGAASLLKAVDSGYQGAMMAPTEILAKQHFDSLSKMLSGLGVRVGLLVSNLKASEKRELLEKVKSGEVDIVVGTHALLEDYIEFKKLGVVITDEQHRFGVNQRSKLSSKGDNPDMLVMTATPIPRTLALILYGDLDISIIDSLPPGRKEIKTYARSSHSRDKVYGFLRAQIAKGRQAYVVCPLVEESETLDIKSAETVYKELSEKFKEYRVGLLHGKQKPSEKDSVMEEFKNGLLDVLVSTTVIEVGVDVPNANIMIIENSERFGLSQLHQLRGRVGRGKHQSYCILINEGKGRISKERARIMEETSDGFVISEKDLELRGPGEFFGIRQHGLPELKFAKLPRDMEILKKAQELSVLVLEQDPRLESSLNSLLKKAIEDFFNRYRDIAFN